ncbi:CDP-diacylglycerol--glycerol-3-phosphate 3-phosphatidyltransferase [Actinomycetaceae bacterium MB13-C1-2]|nr:CDP-diacylglycerol--glycerol-3-phosphate 3-phosphatidyltransferase [Actinomycetaceae bacterium MB13-C1-2]
MMSDTDEAKKADQPSSFNIPNALTALRLVLVPVFLWLLLVDTAPSRWWALAVFMVAAYTDHLDGEIARKKGLITNFGKLADPLADKFMTLGAFIVLSIMGELTWWFTVIVAIREIGITILREVLRRKNVVVAASSGGKLKTVLQIVLIWLMILPWSSFLPAGTVWMQIVTVVIAIVAVAALTVTVVSGAQYVIAAARGSATQESASK